MWQDRAEIRAEAGNAPQHQHNPWPRDAVGEYSMWGHMLLKSLGFAYYKESPHLIPSESQMVPEGAKVTQAWSRRSHSQSGGCNFKRAFVSSKKHNVK